MTKRALGKDVFSEKPLSRERDPLAKELEPKGQIKVSLLLNPEDVEKVEDLQLTLSQKGYGKFSKAEIVRIAIRKLHLDDFARGAK